MADNKRKQVVEDLRALSDQELADTLHSERRKLYELKTLLVMQQKLDNTAAVPQTRKMIARILTLQKERALAASRTGGG